VEDPTIWRYTQPNTLEGPVTCGCLAPHALAVSVTSATSAISEVYAYAPVALTVCWQVIQCSLCC